MSNVRYGIGCLCVPVDVSIVNQDNHKSDERNKRYCNANCVRNRRFNDCESGYQKINAVFEVFTKLRDGFLRNLKDSKKYSTLIQPKRVISRFQLTLVLKTCNR